jgi:hypothetical protein
MGQTRSFGDVGSMSGLLESGHGWAIYEYTPLVRIPYLVFCCKPKRQESKATSYNEANPTQ